MPSPTLPYRTAPYRTVTFHAVPGRKALLPFPLPLPYRTLTKAVRGEGGSSVLVELVKTTPPPGDRPDTTPVSADDAPGEGWTHSVDSGKHPTLTNAKARGGGGRSEMLQLGMMDRAGRHRITAQDEAAAKSAFGLCRPQAGITDRVPDGWTKKGGTNKFFSNAFGMGKQAACVHVLFSKRSKLQSTASESSSARLTYSCGFRLGDRLACATRPI